MTSSSRKDSTDLLFVPTKHVEPNVSADSCQQDVRQNLSTNSPSVSFQHLKVTK